WVNLGELVVFVQAALGVSLIAFGGFSWALDGAAAPVAAVLRLEPAMRAAGALPAGSGPAAAMPAREIRFRDVTFRYPSSASLSTLSGLSSASISSSPRVRGSTGSTGSSGGAAPVLEHFDLTVPAGTSLAIVGQNGAGKTTIAKLLCRLYDPQSGAIEIDGVDLRQFDLAQWRTRVTAVFQDFIRLELPLRDNVAPRGAPDDVVLGALQAAGASKLAALD